LEVRRLQVEFKASERHVCELMAVPRSSCRYRSRKDDSHLQERLRELAREHPRFGYRRLYLYLREEMMVNHKKVQRVYRQLGLTVKRTRRKHLRRILQPRPALTAPNQEWGIDFASDVTHAGQRFRVLGVIDNFTKQCPVLQPSSSFPSRRVTRELERAIAEYGKPQAIRCDNGPELTSRHFLAWAIEWRIDVVHIQPGKPTQNAGMESFNGKLRDECLNPSWFWNLFDARRKISAWQTEYNSRRPHSSLGYLTPDEFARQWRFVSPSYAACRAADQPRQGDPDGLRFASALTRLPRCPEISNQEGETKKEIRL
jgi:putative transposase